MSNVGEVLIHRGSLFHNLETSAEKPILLCILIWTSGQLGASAQKTSVLWWECAELKD